ncbi:hypothetical protein LSCM1_00219 [Leishmania martiniquensis]|uniref:Uncharacterized protein n=1 Tax=Leishmania martiniquensis TaxID=1580590 RepID=A0A836G0S2_9TRYP|nr:hypothetical protein LSCM1_00219 [Leishmania martiniquensis]
MPLSPFIRPLSPLQTQSAPLLPEPCSLTDVFLRPLPVETSGSPASAWNHGTSSAPMSAAAALELRCGGQEARLSAGGAANSPLVTTAAPAPPPLRTQALAPTFHSMVGNVLSVEMLRDSDNAQLQRNFQQHTAAEALRSTSNSTAARTGSRLGSGAVTAQVLSIDDTGEFRPLQHALLPSPAYSSSVHPYASAATACTCAVHSKRADEPPPAASPLSLLNSSATTAVSGAQPSCGTAILRRCSPVDVTDQKEPYRSHLVAQRQLRRAPSQPLFERSAHSRKEAASPTLSLLSCGRGPTAVGSVEVDRCQPYANVPLTAPAACCHGAAASDHTDRFGTVSIEACLAEGKDGESAAISSSTGSRTRVSKARVVSAVVRSALSSARTGALEEREAAASTALPRRSPHCPSIDSNGEENTADEAEEAEKFFDSPHDLSKKTPERMQPELVARLWRKTAPGKQRMATRSAPRTPRSSGGIVSAPDTGAAASAADEPYLPRYVYPALEECRRLLEEIRIASPLLRRCLTPPRPLEGSWDGDGAATVASAPFASSPAGVPSNDTPAPTQRSPIASHTAATTAAVPRRPGALAPRPDARRLYQWDAATASEDLSFMCGPFQQSQERFATSVARQLQRLQAVGARLYGKTHDTWAPPGKVQVSSRQSRSLISSGPLTSSWGTADPDFDVDTHNRGDASIKESPSKRLRRLLRETEAALPSLLGREVEPPLPATPTAISTTSLPSTINHAHGSSDGCADRAHRNALAARAPGVSMTSMESRFPFAEISRSLAPARPPISSPLPYHK